MSPATLTTSTRPLNGVTTSLWKLAAKLRRSPRPRAMATFVRKYTITKGKQNKCKSIFDLPPELRLLIYEYTTTRLRHVSVFADETVYMDDRVHIRGSTRGVLLALSLQRVCRLFWLETYDIIWDNITFDLYAVCQYDYVSEPAFFGRKVLLAQVRHVVEQARHVRIRFGPDPMYYHLFVFSRVRKLWQDMGDRLIAKDNLTSIRLDCEASLDNPGGPSQVDRTLLRCLAHDLPPA